MNLIEEEYEESKQFEFELIEGTDLVKLNRRNVALVEAMIRNDSAYLKAADKTAGKKGKYKGSTAYWLNKLKQVVINGVQCSKKEYNEIIENSVYAVNRDNRTHVNADRVGIKEISKRIADLTIDELKKSLLDLSGFELIKKIEEKTNPNLTGYKARENYSFATKWCHYACFYFFEEKAEQDAYSKYDNIVGKIIMKYISYYGIKHNGKKIQKKHLQNYEVFYPVVGEIINEASKKEGKKISRNGFDHLLWYYYKGRI